MAAEEATGTVASVLDHFSERDEVVSLIAVLLTIFHDLDHVYYTDTAS